MPPRRERKSDACPALSILPSVGDTLLPTDARPGGTNSSARRWRRDSTASKFHDRRLPRWPARARAFRSHVFFSGIPYLRRNSESPGSRSRSVLDTVSWSMATLFDYPERLPDSDLHRVLGIGGPFLEGGGVDSNILETQPRHDERAG